MIQLKRFYLVHIMHVHIHMRIMHVGGISSDFNIPLKIIIPAVLASVAAARLIYSSRLRGCGYAHAIIIVTGLATAHVMLIMRVHCSCNRPRIVARSASEGSGADSRLVTSVLSHRIPQKPTDCKVWWRFKCRCKKISFPAYLRGVWRQRTFKPYLFRKSIALCTSNAPCKVAINPFRVSNLGRRVGMLQWVTEL